MRSERPRSAGGGLLHAAMWAVVCFAGWASAAAGQLVPLRVEAGRVVDGAGQPVVLRGVNLGSWLLIEPWMLGLGEFRDQASLVAHLEQRFGVSEAARLIGVFRDSWITQRDFDQIASLGFNAVRLPFDHAVLEPESTPFRVDAAGFDRLERAMRMAEAAGLYVVLDMHAAPGGQSTDGPSGDVNGNDLWGNDENYERTAWLWQRVARVYKNRAVLAAYDLLNEPYGDFGTDHRADLIEVMGRTIEAVRLIDPERPIFVPAVLNGIAFYGDPAARGWSGVGLSQNVYPGLFDAREPALGEYARFWEQHAASRGELSERWGQPILIGEFQPLWDAAGAPYSTRQFFDRAGAEGWWAFVWSWKLIKPEAGIGSNNWYVVTNGSASGLQAAVRSGTAAQVEAAFRALATEPLSTDGLLAQALTEQPSRAPVWPVVETARVTAASDALPAGYATADIGIAPAGGQVVSGAGGAGEAVELFGGGLGIDNLADEDSLRLMHRPAVSTFTMSARLTGLEAWSPDAFAGLMVRGSLAPDAAFAWVGVGQDGRVRARWRSAAGFGASDLAVDVRSLPVELAVRRRSGAIELWYADVDGAWKQAGGSLTLALGSSPVVGPAVTSGDELVLAGAAFEALMHSTGTALPTAIGGSGASGVNLLANAGFESGGSTATSWAHSGAQLTRESGWTPRRSGNAILALRHWEATSGATQVASQTVSGLTPGAAYVFQAFVNHDRAGPGLVGASAVEVRVRTTGSPSYVLEATRVDAGLISEAGWSVVSTRFRPTGSSVVVEIRCEPGASGPRDGALKIDDAGVYAEGL